jgi:hypothetical protein
VAAAAVALQALFWTETRLFGDGTSLYQPTSLVVVGALAAAFAAAALLRRRGRTAA